MSWPVWCALGVGCALASQQLTSRRVYVLLDVLTAVVGAWIGGATASSIGARPIPALLAALAAALLTLLLERSIGRSLRRRRALDAPAPTPRLP